MPPYRQFACYLDQLRHKRLKLLKITCKLPIRRHQLNHHKKLLRPTPPTSLQFKLLPIPTAIPMKPAWHNQTQPPTAPRRLKVSKTLLQMLLKALTLPPLQLLPLKHPQHHQVRKSNQRLKPQRKTPQMETWPAKLPLQMTT